MKKLSILLAVSLLTISTYSQSVFGVKVDGNKTEVVNKFKAKGFKIPITPSATVTSLQGYVDGVKYDVLVCSTPITKKVWKIAVYLPEQNSWYDLKNTYGPGYLCCLHCSADVAQMIKYVYGQYDQLLQREAEQKPISNEKTTKKRTKNS